MQDTLPDLQDGKGGGRRDQTPRAKIPYLVSQMPCSCVKMCIHLLTWMQVADKAGDESCSPHADRDAHAAQGLPVKQSSDRKVISCQICCYAAPAPQQEKTCLQLLQQNSLCLFLVCIAQFCIMLHKSSSCNVSLHNQFVGKTLADCACTMLHGSFVYSHHLKLMLCPVPG